MSIHSIFKVLIHKNLKELFEFLESKFQNKTGQ